MVQKKYEVRLSSEEKVICGKWSGRAGVRPRRSPGHAFC